MRAGRSIVIGYDNDALLPLMINGIRKITPSEPVISCTSRTYELISLVKTLQTDLVILSFRSNHRVLSEIAAQLAQPTLPFLFIMQRTDEEAPLFDRHSAVFTYPVERLDNSVYFAARIQSVFLLHHQPYQSQLPVPATLLPDASETKHLSRYVMELDQKIEVLQKVKERITGLYPRVDDPVRMELMSIVTAIKASAGSNKLWADFKLYFEQSNPGFLFKLAQKHPDLTQNDLKYCCYLKMNMSNDDIRNLLGINQESVRTHKYRLKKKMALSKEQSLRSYLIMLNNQPQTQHTLAVESSAF